MYLYKNNSSRTLDHSFDFFRASSNWMRTCLDEDYWALGQTVYSVLGGYWHWGQVAARH